MDRIEWIEKRGGYGKQEDGKEGLRKNFELRVKSYIVLSQGIEQC